MSNRLADEDKSIIKRTVPKPNNKIHAAAVAKLYVAYPDRSRWTYTGLQGAIVLANDLVGHTWWVKLVDISPSNRGVIWDQEIYDTFQYNQDRTFFHSFELEDCMAGLSFADEKEAKQFKKKMDEREKNAHRNTKAKAFAISAGNVPNGPNGSAASQERHHGFSLGGLFSRHSTHEPQAHVRQAAPPTPPKSQESLVDTLDPKLLQELRQMGISDDQLAQNFDFIKTYIEHTSQTKATTEKESRARAPPPPPPPPTAVRPPISPQNTGGTSVSKRGPAPAPPPPRRGRAPDSAVSVAQRQTPSPTRPPSPPRPKFAVPPPLPDAGKLVHENHAPSRARSSSNVANPGPPPPPRPPKTPLDEAPSEPPSKFGIASLFGSSKPPQPPARSPVPPPPPARETPTPAAAPPPPPRAQDTSPSAPPPPPPPPPPPARDTTPVPPPLPTAARPPPLPPTTSGPSLPPPLPPTSNAPPPPPLPPTSNAPPPPPLPPTSNAPPPPPLPPTSNAPPPPPLPPSNSSGPPLPPPPPPGGSAPLPKVGGGRGNLLADIRGGASLRKVSDTEKRDRSAALVPGGSATSPPGGAPNPGAGGEAGLAGALASALAARKSKVAHSDDEGDDDDW